MPQPISRTRFPAIFSLSIIFANILLMGQTSPNSGHRAEEIPSKMPFLSHHFQYGDYDIWGLTAMLILRLIEIGCDYKPSYPVHHPQSATWMDLSQQFRDEYIEIIKKKYEFD